MTIPAPPQRPKHDLEKRCPDFCVFLTIYSLVALSFFLGIILPPIGIAKMVEINSIANDFERLPNACEITSMTHEARTRQFLRKVHWNDKSKSVPICFDTYTLTFDVVDQEQFVFKDLTDYEKRKRCQGKEAPLQSALSAEYCLYCVLCPCSHCSPKRPSAVRGRKALVDVAGPVFGFSP